MKSILKVTAILEGITGLSLLTIPTFFASVLLGTPPTEASGILICRLAGVALISIAIACWLYRNKSDASELIKALVFYNIGAAGLLVYAGFTGLSGLGIWPATVIHLALAVWCVKAIRTVKETAS